MNIMLISSKIQFKNPVTGKATYAIKDHYHARRIVANVDGEEKMYRFLSDELPFDVQEEDMIQAIKNKIEHERTENNNAE